MAEENKLVTKSIRTLPKQGPQSNVYASASNSEQPILMHLEGDFEGFYSFLQSLERQPRIMRISRMDLGKSKNGKNGYIHANFDMSVFFERDGKD